MRIVLASLLLMAGSASAAEPATAPPAPAAETPAASPATPPTAAAPAGKPTAIDTAASCTQSCHLDLGTKPVQHPPAKRGTGCKKCHEPETAGQHAFKPLPKKSAELCLGCHEELKTAAAHLHKPFKSGTCTKCHDPHQSAEARLLKKPVPKLCHGCHDADEFSGAHPHPPVAQGKCNDCHEPHQGERGRLLKGAYPDGFYAPYKADAYGLCFDCHKSAAFAEPRTLTATRFRNGNLNLHHRHVNRDKGRGCSACHAPHGTAQPSLVTGAVQFGTKRLPMKYEQTATGGSCAGPCHVAIEYDRCEPADSALRTSPRQGTDAAREVLAQQCDRRPEPVERDSGKVPPKDKDPPKTKVESH